MPIAVMATWRARPGQEGGVIQILQGLAPLCRTEPGNLFLPGPAVPG